MRLLRFALLLLWSALLLAQATPSGAPETTLAGINIRFNNITDVEELYGEQQAMYAVSQKGYAEGSKLYQWTRLTLTLKVLTQPSPAGEKISAIEIKGEGEPGKKAVNSTRRGLRLGAKSSDIKKLYDVDPVNGSATIKWADGTTLIVGVSEKGRVNKLELRAGAIQE